MKKLFALSLVTFLTFSLVACGSDKAKDENQTVTETPSTEDGTKDNTENAENTGDTHTAIYGDNVAVADLKQAVVDVLGEDYWPNTEVPEEMLGTSFGITSDMYDEYIAEMPMISTNVDTIIIIKAKEDKIDEVEAALTAYRDKMVNDTLQYPMNLGKIQASRIESFGNIVCFVQLGADTSTASETSEEAAIEQCQEANEKALDAISAALPK